MQQVVTDAPTAGYSAGPAWNRTPVVAAPTRPSGLLPPGPACQPCPDCGGLECLCRPRFFAGQLLTEQDLNRLDQYVVSKNRLHNRYLVGHGVVCGLEVRCSPCADTVTVSAGYAIDPCGSDIIVCSPDTVDICKLIKACTPSTQVDCGPYKDATRCKDMEQEWVLAIRYQETPSRGITPLTGGARCSCGSGGGSCSCGGAAAKPCGCGSMLPAGSCCGQTMSSVAPVSTNRPRRGAPPECEPTVTCEAYRYEVFQAPVPATAAPNPVRGLAGFAGTIGGELFANIACCVQSVIAMFPPAPTVAKSGNGKTAWSNYCCQTRQLLIQYLVAHGGTDCQAIAKLRAVACPSPTIQDDTQFQTELNAAFEAEIVILLEILLGCFCSAALPPCPAPGDPRVPLASVRVRVSDCAIISVCDWTPLRKHVVTTKTLGYWLGWLPYVPLIRTFMQEVCCAVLGLRDQLGTAPAVAGAATHGAAESRQEPQGLDRPITFGAQAYQASNPISEAVAANLAGGAQSISVNDLMRALLDPVDPGTPGQAGAAEKLAETPHAKVLAEIARPLMNGLAPLLRAATGNLGQATRSPPAADTTATLAAMRGELDALRSTVTAQQSALDALRHPPG